MEITAFAHTTQDYQVIIIPRFVIDIEKPYFCNMDWKWEWRKITIGFGWIVFKVGIEINFE
jgi:hypothetical protein